MPRNLMPTTLQANQLWGGGVEDPMAGLANLMDVMLVFACGLMLALVTYWNVDLSDVATAATKDNFEIVDGELVAGTGSLEGESANFEPLGTAYRDASTNTIYVIPAEEG